MNKIEKIKEYIIGEFPSKYIQREFNLKLSRIDIEYLKIDVLDYYNDFYNGVYEWEILNEIRDDIDKKFNLGEKEISEIDKFLVRYINVLINKHKYKVKKKRRKW